jgi:pyruvate/2-oxoglutarate dehydrogenase complex dihydrolipoamide dehydrogenase (E3) component
MRPGWCREARHLPRYGITVGEFALQYDELLARVGEVVRDVRARSPLRERMDALGVTVYERVGAARFVDPHTLETERGPRLRAEKLIICTGGVGRRIAVPGFELTRTHSDVWALTAVPASMLVVGAGSTGVQIASMFHAFGTRVELFERGPHILPSEEEEVVAAADRAEVLSRSANWPEQDRAIWATAMYAGRDYLAEHLARTGRTGADRCFGTTGIRPLDGRSFKRERTRRGAKPSSSGSPHMSAGTPSPH